MNAIITLALAFAGYKFTDLPFMKEDSEEVNVKDLPKKRIEMEETEDSEEEKYYYAKVVI